MHIPCLAEEIVASAVEKAAADEEGARSVWCPNCRRFSEVVDPHLPPGPVCRSYQVDFMDDEPKEETP